MIERATRIRETRWNLYALLAPGLLGGEALLLALAVQSSGLARWTLVLAAAGVALAGFLLLRRFRRGLSRLE